MSFRSVVHLNAKLLDAYVRKLSLLTVCDDLREYEAVTLPDGGVEAHASAYARAYRVRDTDGSFACLRFWMNMAPESLVETYEALQQAPEVHSRCGVAEVEFFNEAIAVEGQAIPAVLMSWVEGSSLADTVHVNCRNSTKLLEVAEALRLAFASLNNNNVSHGDLRSSNILIKDRHDPIRVSFIDLDSLRWKGGPNSTRIMGGNEAWDQMRQRDGVSLLASDYLDQAMAYLTVVAVAAERTWWDKPTDGFLNLGRLRADTHEVFSCLEQMKGPPAYIANAVKKAMEQPGHWTEVADAIRSPVGESLTAGTFWDLAFGRADSRKRSVPKAPPISKAPPKPAPRPVRAQQVFNNKPLQPSSLSPRWVWYLVVATASAIAAYVYFF